MNITLDISPLQAHVLNTLKENGPTSMILLADEVHISKQQTIRIVGHLVSQDLVQRTFDKRDRRLIKIVLTAVGGNSSRKLKTTNPQIPGRQAGNIR